MPAPELVGRSLDSLTLEERLAAAGKWIALELYSPETTPLRLIEAIGGSAEDCMRQVAARGLNPKRYEYVTLPAPM
jgi:hypothetical protein